MEQGMLDKLYEELPVAIKPGGQGFKFIKTKDVINRLNKTFEGDWSTKVIKTEKIGDEYLVEVQVSRLTPDGIVLATHAGFGSAKVFGNNELGNIVKSAKSKAIKDAAKSFGVGLMLNTSKGGGNYAQDADSGIDDPAFTVTNCTLPNTPPMGSIAQPQGGFTNTTPPQGFTGTETAPVNNTPPVSNSSASVPPTGNVPAGNMPSTPFGDTNTMPNQSGGFPQAQAGPNVTTEATPPVQTQGNLPPMGNTPVTQSSMAPSAGGEMDNAKITSIQKIVLTQKMAETNKSFKEFIIEEFAAVNHILSYEVNEIDDLLYKDTLLIVAN